MTSDASIALEASDTHGQALPGEGKGSAQEPVMDKLSALNSAMNDKYGADLGDADKVWVQQHWVVVKCDDKLQAIAQSNERSATRTSCSRR